MDGRRFSSALQTAGGRFPVLAENQRRGRRPYRGTVPLSYDGAESPESQSQGSKRYNDIYRVQMPNITPHVCRHTYCSNMAKSGMNPKTLQYLMGHSDIAVTLNVYTHVGLEDTEKELQKMQGLENTRKEMGISDKDDNPLKQNMFKVI